MSFLDPYPHVQVINYGAVSASNVQLIKKDGKPVLRNVFSAQMYLWNSGNTSLRKVNILRELKIEAPEIEILDVKPVKVSRADITKMATTENSSRVITVAFEILEPNDGFSLNVLYAADKPAVFVLNGVIEGVRGFSPVEMIPAGDVALKTLWQLVKSGAGLGLGLGMLLGGLGFLTWFGKKVPESKIARWIGRGILAIVVALFVVSVIGGLLVTVVKAKREAVENPRALIPRTLTE